MNSKRKNIEITCEVILGLCWVFLIMSVIFKSFKGMYAASAQFHYFVVAIILLGVLASVIAKIIRNATKLRETPGFKPIHFLLHEAKSLMGSLMLVLVIIEATKFFWQKDCSQWLLYGLGGYVIWIMVQYVILCLTKREVNSDAG